MERLKSIQEFKSLRDRLAADRDETVPTIVISAGTCGQASGANDLIRVAKRELLSRGLVDKINLRITGCHGFCEKEPSVLIEPTGTFYPNLSTDDMVQIVDAVYNGTVLKDLLCKHPDTGEPIEKLEDLPFYRSQIRTILGGNQKVDPIRIYDYIENAGYVALADVLEMGNVATVVTTVKESGLRGRGGGGFPTGLKWEFLAKQGNGRAKYLVCNADEGDPGAYMDRSILEGNPHSIIEGMLIGAFGTGATNGVLYVRNEYPLAIKHLVIALRQARELGLLGDNILGTDFSFDLRLVRGAGAFVCGEETALIRSIEGKMGEPRQRPPYPVQKGINGRPTAINNVETWANIPVIFKQGAKAYAETGTKGNSGTKIFSLVGKIRNTGLVEVPMGMTIGEIVYDIGGGPIGDAKIKAVQTGGPSGGCIPASRFDLKIDYDSLAEAGSIMGSGGMIVMDEHTCMVDLAKYFMAFLKDESCGKCFTCRKGTQRMYEILDDISKGLGTLEHLDLLEELAHVVQDTTMCGLGQTASNPVLSTLRYFRDEYEEHVVQKRCRAFVCADLVGAPCQAACPVGTEAWRYIAQIAHGEYKDAYDTIRRANPFPSVCARVCNHPCETQCRSGLVGSDPIAIRELKRFITDNVDPSSFKPARQEDTWQTKPKVAVIGAGPAGLAAAHCLSLEACEVTVFEAEAEPGGMLLSGIPSYRLPRDVIKKEIESLIDENVTVKCGVALGTDFTVDSLLDDDYKAVFIALGAHKSKPLKLDGEDYDGVYPALEFLKRFNRLNENLAKGRVGVIGGGNSAIDAARVALRQKDVESVTLLYRRTRNEMPAIKEEIDAAVEEGVKLETLVTPMKIEATSEGRLAAVQFIRNELGDVDASGRRSPVPVQGSEFDIPLDTLIVAIGDEPDLECVSAAEVEISNWGTLVVNPATLATNKPGVFAGGDVVTGPNTVIDAIAAGKKAAVMICRYLRGEVLEQPAQVNLPDFYIEPIELSDEEIEKASRAESPTISIDRRKTGFDEVEQTLPEEAAICEARRCLRCDLDFTRPPEPAEEISVPVEEGQSI
ncbi:FAD-dependent oxidoreductase [bacterium]|nr:FAD-dependent oxidoreductase [bacterium]